MSPDSEGLDNGTQLVSRFSETIFKCPRLTLSGDVHDDPGSFEILQPLREQGGRHARQPAPQFIETPRTQYEFAQNEGTLREKQKGKPSCANG